MPSDNKSNSKPTAADNKSGSKTTVENKSGSKTTADNKSSSKTTTAVNKSKTTTADNCVLKNGSSSSSSSPQPPKQPPTDVLAACSGGQCFERQRELIECLTYETTASHNLDEQLALDERSLAGQLVAATDNKERSTAALFDLVNRMDAAFCEYRESVMAAETASRALAEQRDAVHDDQAKVENLSSRLAEAKTSVAAYVQLKHDSGDFSVYATGCGPENNERSTRSGCVARATVVGAMTKPASAAFKTPQPPPPLPPLLS